MNSINNDRSFSADGLSSVSRRFAGTAAVVVGCFFGQIASAVDGDVSAPSSVNSGQSYTVTVTAQDYWDWADVSISKSGGGYAFGEDEASLTTSDTGPTTAHFTWEIYADDYEYASGSFNVTINGTTNYPPVPSISVDGCHAAVKVYRLTANQNVPPWAGDGRRQRPWRTSFGWNNDKQ